MINKKILMIMVIAGSALCIGLLLYRNHTSKKLPYTIGILQTASHPALDAAREGFIQTIEKALPGKVAFIIHNAQGSVVNAHTIAQSFHVNNDIKGVFAIATPAAQAMVTLEHAKPIFIAAVTDPKAAGLLDYGNVCGACDKIDGTRTVELLHALVPTAQTVALLFTTAEMNSRLQVQELQQALKTQGLTGIEIGVTSESDIPVAVTSACQKADALLIPSDNTLASSMPLVASIALKHNKPVITNYREAVTQGALAAVGVNYTANGQQAANQALEVLVEGKKPSQLPITAPNAKLFINKQVLATLSLSIPTTLAEQALFI